MGIFEETDDGRKPKEGDITIDDVVDEFGQLYDTVESDDDDGSDFDPADLFDQAEETAREESIDTLEHLISGDCDSEKCNEIRDELGIGGSADADADEDTDEDDDTTEEADADGTDDVQGDDDGSGDGDDSLDSDAEPVGDDGGDSGDDESGVAWEEDENIFGEKI